VRTTDPVSILPIARLRYTAADTTWTLFSRDRNLRFHTYDLIKPSRNVDDLLAETALRASSCCPPPPDVGVVCAPVTAS
jgi:hypothetical protein